MQGTWLRFTARARRRIQLGYAAAFVFIPVFSGVLLTSADVPFWVGR